MLHSHNGNHNTVQISRLYMIIICAFLCIYVILPYVIHRQLLPLPHNDVPLVVHRDVWSCPYHYHWHPIDNLVSDCLPGHTFQGDFTIF